MKKLMMITVSVVLGLCLAGNALADVEADKQECVAKTEAAAAMMKNEGLVAALAETNKKDGKFVQGTIYVFTMNLDGVMIAHPMKPNLIGKNMLDFKDAAGKEFFKDFIAVAKDPGSGWVEYMWPKPGEDDPVAKISYILRVDLTFGDSVEQYLVGAGVYK